MFIKEITFERRNDFSAVLECEHCEATQLLKTGYNDDNYHDNVLPSIKCKTCNKDREGKQHVDK